MTVLITGDLHAATDCGKLMEIYFNSDNELGLTKNDYLIVCGDFGFVWNNDFEMDKYYLDWLNDKPWTTLFVDGNHENHDRLNNEFDVKEWNGGKVHRIRDSIIHLMRGQVFNIDGKKFFTMGGAYSHDKNWRKPGHTWWEDEVPSDDERAEAIANLERHNWCVDYVITHEAPLDIADNLIYDKRDRTRRTNEFVEWLQYAIANKLEYKQWYNGHYHLDKDYIDGKHMAMYDRIVSIDEPEKNLCGYHRSWWY